MAVTKNADQNQANATKFLVLPIIVLILAQMGTSGDNGAVAIAANALTEHLNATMANIQMANMVYSLMAGAFMIAGGLMGTIIGWKRNFRIGALLCAAGEVVMAFAPTMGVFIWGGRVLVGFGASFMIPSVLGLIPKIYEPQQRVLAFGCIGAASGLSALLPLILGIVMQFFGYKVTFLVLAAYFFIVFLLSFKLPAIKADEKGLKFDGLGVGLAALGLFAFLIGVSKISEWGLITPFANAPFTVFGYSPALFLAALGIIILAILLKVEKKVEEKNGICLIPQSFTHTPQVVAGLIASALTFFFMGVQGILMGPYLLLVAGWTPIDVGAISLVTGLPTFAFAIGIPKLFPKANPRKVICWGYIIMALALVIMRFSITMNGVIGWGIILGSFVAGVGAGTVSAQANNVVALAVDDRDASQSGGIQTTMRNVGQAIGVAVLGAVLMFGISSNMSSMAISKGVNPQAVDQVVKMNITLAGNEHFAEQTKNIEMTPAEREALTESYISARYDSTRRAYLVGAIITFAGVFSTPWITIFSKTKTEDEQVAEAK